MQLKPFFFYEQQVELLKNKGVVIEDEEACIAFLKRVNYYRLSAYFLPFGKSYDGLAFSEIRRIYEFDGALRAVLSPIIERIEITLRSVVSYCFSEKYGAEGYLSASNFSRKHNHEAFQSHLVRCLKENNKSNVVMHHEEKYDGHYPLWVIVEFFSLGMLSYFYSDLTRDDKKAITRALGYKSDRKLESWLRCLTDLRNRCAHYSRLYYWSFSAVPLLYEEEAVNDERIERSLYPQIIMLKEMINDSDVWESMFVIPFTGLIDEYKGAIRLKHIGFPESWKTSLSY